MEGAPVYIFRTMNVFGLALKTAQSSPNKFSVFLGTLELLLELEPFQYLLLLVTQELQIDVQIKLFLIKLGVMLPCSMSR